MCVAKGKVRLSDRIIFGLIAVAVLSPVNDGQRIPNGYYLTYGTTDKLFINEWWGRASDFPSVVERDPVPPVKLDFGDWDVLTLLATELKGRAAVHCVGAGSSSSMNSGSFLGRL